MLRCKTAGRNRYVNGATVQMKSCPPSFACRDARDTGMAAGRRIHDVVCRRVQSTAPADVWFRQPFVQPRTTAKTENCFHAISGAGGRRWSVMVLFEGRHHCLVLLAKPNPARLCQPGGFPPHPFQSFTPRLRYSMLLSCESSGIVKIETMTVTGGVTAAAASRLPNESSALFVPVSTSHWSTRERRTEKGGIDGNS